LQSDRIENKICRIFEKWGLIQLYSFHDYLLMNSCQRDREYNSRIPHTIAHGNYPTGESLPGMDEPF